MMPSGAAIAEDASAPATSEPATRTANVRMNIGSFCCRLGGPAKPSGSARALLGSRPDPAWRPSANVWRESDAGDEFRGGLQSELVPPIPEGEPRMASLVLKMSVSLDGYVAPPDGSTDWAAAGRSPDGASWTLETVSKAGAHLMGATTYARWAGFWPTAPGPFAKPMNDIPKVVFSDSLESADWPRRRSPPAT